MKVAREISKTPPAVPRYTAEEKVEEKEILSKPTQDLIRLTTQPRLVNSPYDNMLYEKKFEKMKEYA